MEMPLKHAMLLREELSVIRSQLRYLRLLRIAAKDNYNPLEPRDQNGKWTVGLAGRDVSTDISAARKIVSIDCAGAMTGISTIDETTTSLCKTLARTMETMDFIPEWTPRAYGTAVHVTFGTEVEWVVFAELVSSTSNIASSMVTMLVMGRPEVSGRMFCCEMISAISSRSTT
ncbi:hypothetical protein [Rhodopseudomonas telluris]|uniref:Uncharacterized protein n=1 Tax=Rhodopseudomonas telluris TaxID=644215 RepID=A0ABV6EPJ5_9BRAD